MNRVQAILHTIVAVALIAGYVALQIAGSDSTLIGGALLGYLGGGAAQIAGAKIYEAKNGG